jgi:hypothetical protein
VADELDEKEVAPHGRDEQGVPLAPYGYKEDGNPRKSNRGRKPGSVAAPPKKPTANTKSGSRPRARSRAETKGQLLELVGMVTTPLATAGHSPAVRARIGERHATALAGDAVIIEALAPDLLEGVMMFADRKPGILAWMDKAEDAAPAIVTAKAALSIVKALVQNHQHPDPQLAAAAGTMVKVKAARYAAAIEQEAAALGLVDEPVIPEQRAA